MKIDFSDEEIDTIKTVMGSVRDKYEEMLHDSKDYLADIVIRDLTLSIRNCNNVLRTLNDGEEVNAE